MILMILDVYPLRRWKTAWRARVLEKVPFALLSLLASAVAVVAVRAGGSVSSLADLGVAQRVAISACLLVFYLRKALLPIGLSRLYELPVGFDPFGPVYLPSAVVVLAITSTAFVLRSRYPWSREGVRKPNGGETVVIGWARVASADERRRGAVRGPDEEKPSKMDTQRYRG